MCARGCVGVFETRCHTIEVYFLDLFVTAKAIVKFWVLAMQARSDVATYPALFALIVKAPQVQGTPWADAVRGKFSILDRFAVLVYLQQAAPAVLLLLAQAAHEG